MFWGCGRSCEREHILPYRLPASARARTRYRQSWTVTREADSSYTIRTYPVATELDIRPPIPLLDTLVEFIRRTSSW
jgi:hypothetical protein